MILLFTDFGAEGPYLGQMDAVLRQAAPGAEIINLVSDAPAGDPRLSAYLLAALCRFFPKDSIFVGVVDPGVGGDRLPVVLKADGRWFVGPDNGLFNTVAVQASQVEWQIIGWRPEQLSNSFHGRDLFAPVAARIERGDMTWSGGPYAGPDLSGWPTDFLRIVYVDHYGNAITGARYAASLAGLSLAVNDHRIPEAKTFSDVPEGQPFWYCNSMGLVEIAVNRGRADAELGLAPGMEIGFV
ncbi:SAM hydrolase/SAM-dependent halogenase family protein [Candidatus Methylocalor cossyra]|uniref:S-adenosyl-L-methionine hydrolase (Adenosine-forming) n=1 Tax=Candidatus Methylocalor cossyra TaxID=3108543 RepID=A0ABP1CAH6_9GAMM